MKQKVFLLSLLPLMTAGCFDYALQRSARFQQIASTNDPQVEFQIDTSQIPSEWIKERAVLDHPWGKEIHFTIAQDHPVKIVLVPLGTR